MVDRYDVDGIGFPDFLGEFKKALIKSGTIPKDYVLREINWNKAEFIDLLLNRLNPDDYVVITRTNRGEMSRGIFAFKPDVLEVATEKLRSIMLEILEKVEKDKQ